MCLDCVEHAIECGRGGPIILSGLGIAIGGLNKKPTGGLTAQGRKKGRRFRPAPKCASRRDVQQHLQLNTVRVQGGDASTRWRLVQKKVTPSRRPSRHTTEQLKSSSRLGMCRPKAAGTNGASGVWTTAEEAVRWRTLQRMGAPSTKICPARTLHRRSFATVSPSPCYSEVGIDRRFQPQMRLDHGFIARPLAFSPARPPPPRPDPAP